LAEEIVNHLHTSGDPTGLESINLVLGTKGVFDIFIDGELIYSKHETGIYPEPSVIINAIKEYQSN
jgi:selT/selW/selH-like putative selenoprotein